MKENNIYDYSEKECLRCRGNFKPMSGRQKYCKSCKDYGRLGSAICQICGVGFEIEKNTTGKYCSFKCSSKSLEAYWKKEIPCPVCSKLFTAKKQEQKTCSPYCGNQVTKERTKERRNKVCPQCLRQFYTKNYNTQIFCSKSCAGLSRRHNEIRHCERCKKELPHSDYKAKYCSKVCAELPIGSLRTRPNGYKEIKVGTNNWVLEHRYVMEKHLDRELSKTENVHHISGVRGDNRLENLELWYVGQPKGQRVKDLLDYMLTYHKDSLVKRLEDETNPGFRDS